jgi:ethanolamine utilization protein EutN
MLIGRVVGTVVATRKDEKLEGLRFLMVKQIDLELGESDKIVVAADSVGAGLGEVVLFASGSSARQTIATDNRPVDATIMAIVDSFDVRGQVRYQKLTDDMSGNYDPVE